MYPATAPRPLFHSALRRAALTMTACAVLAATSLAAVPAKSQAVPSARPASPAIDPNATVPLPGLTLTYADYSLIQSALADAQADRWTEANAAAARITDPVATRIIHWLRLQDRNSSATHTEVLRFLGDNPDWPRRARLERRAEVAMLA